MSPADASPLDLPPGFSAVTLRESGDAFAHAKTIAAGRGAGTLVPVRRYDLLEFAVVLDPDAPLASARRAHFAAMNAIGDALGAHCPPERQVEFRWPDAVLFDGGLVGSLRLGWAGGWAEGAGPRLLGFARLLRTPRLAPVEARLR